MAKTEKSGQMSPEQIQKLKEKYGDVFAYECDNKVCYLRRPDRKILGLSMSIDTGNDPFKKNAILIDNCWLGGDEALKDVDAYFYGLSNYVEGLIEVKMGELKKL